MSMKETKIKCPCCGWTTVDEYGICDVCGWANDPHQLDDHDYKGDANQMSLNEAKKAFAAGKQIK